MKKVHYTVTDTETGKTEKMTAYVAKDAAELAAILEKHSKPKDTRCDECGEEIPSGQGYGGRSWVCSSRCYSDLMGICFPDY